MIRTFSFRQGSAEQENSQIITGQPKKGRKQKFPGQDRKIRKLKCNSNQEYYLQENAVKNYLWKNKKNFLTIIGIWATIIYRQVSLKHAVKNS